MYSPAKSSACLAPCIDPRLSAAQGHVVSYAEYLCEEIRKVKVELLSKCPAVRDGGGLATSRSASLQATIARYRSFHFLPSSSKCICGYYTASTIIRTSQLSTTKEHLPVRLPLIGLLKVFDLPSRGEVVGLVLG